MIEHDLVHIALENLQKASGIKGKWISNGAKEIDGRLELKVENQLLNFNTETIEIIRWFFSDHTFLI